MSLIQAPAPDEVKQAYLNGLGLPSTKILTYSAPIYGLSIEQLKSGMAPLTLERLGWQFLTVDDKDVAVAGEVAEGSDRADGAMETSLTRGVAIDKAVDAYRAASANPEIAGKPWQLRRLRTPALRIEAFWLKGPPVDDVLAESDLVYPFFTFHPELNGKLMPALDFLKYMQWLADQGPDRKPGDGSEAP